MVSVGRILRDYRDAGSVNGLLALWGFVDDTTFLTKAGHVGVVYRVRGVDRRLFFLSLLLGAATFNLFYSFLAGLLMAGGLYGFALWATARDPEMLRILLASSKARRRYDPGKHDRVDVEVASW